MSTTMIDVRPAGHDATVSMFDAFVGNTHPRGQGFRVLSRMARTQSPDDEYAPRHRRDVPVDVDVHTSIAV